MTTLPLAIYTAHHGLSWTYPREEIPFAELDACRKALGGLPDFDSGEPGYEGVWITESRVFILRCQSVKAWDFRGRDATYLAVTWVPREMADKVDYESVLQHSSLCEPNRNPLPFFKVQMSPCITEESFTSLPQSLSDGFKSVVALINLLSPTQTARLKRSLGEEGVSCRYDVPTTPIREQIVQSPIPLPEEPLFSIEEEPLLAPKNCVSTDVPKYKIALVLALVALLLSLVLNALLGFFWWTHRSVNHENDAKSDAIENVESGAKPSSMSEFLQKTLLNRKAEKQLEKVSNKEDVKKLAVSEKTSPLPQPIEVKKATVPERASPSPQPVEAKMQSTPSVETENKTK